MRLGTLFVASCMMVIAASAGAVVYFGFGFGGTEAVIVSIAALTALALYNMVSTRLDARSLVGPQLADLSRGGADLARQVAEMGRRLALVESRLERTLAVGENTTGPLAMEISELGTLVNQLAESVALHEAHLNEIERAKIERSRIEKSRIEKSRIEPAKLPPAGAGATAADRPPTRNAGPAEPAPSPPSMTPATPAAIAIPAPDKPKPVAVQAMAADQGADQEMLATIRGAIEANRIDLHLQPIVTLPQRKVRYYEAMSRLRAKDGEVVLAAQFISQAEAGGLMPKIDNLMVFRCVQVLRRLLIKNRDVGVFCNLAAATLTDAVIFPQLLEFLDANRAIAPSLVLEFTQSGLLGAGPIESESLAALNELGYRFSMDNVADLRLEPRDLASRGFRFLKLPASLILNRGAAADIHPADFPDLLGRFGISLIAEKIESEGSVVDLLDLDVKFGQGFLFSPPRPVRAEALQGIADRNDVVVREAGTAAGEGTAMVASVGSAAVPRAPAPGKDPRSAGLARIARRV